MATIVDSYSESNQDGGYDTAIAGEAYGQSFTGSSGTLSRVTLYLKRNATTPDGVNLTVRIYAHTGTYGTSSKPTGSALAESNPVTEASLGTSYSLINFDFSGDGKIELQDSTNYVWVIYSDNTPVRYYVGGDNSSPSHSGNRCVWNGSSWLAWTNHDHCFYVYKDDPPVDVDVSLSPISTSTSVPTPTITEGTGASISLSPLTLSTTLLDAVTTGDANLTLSLIDAGSVTVTTPTITEGVGVDTTLSLIEAGSVTIPEVDVGIYQRVFLEAIALSTSLYEPTISVERNWGQPARPNSGWLDQNRSHGWLYDDSDIIYDKTDLLYDQFSFKWTTPTKKSTSWQ